MIRAVRVDRAGTWPTGEAVGSVTLAFDDRYRRRLRLTADDGTAFLLDLERATLLGPGDGLALAGGGWIGVRAAPEELLEIRPRDGVHLARLAWHLGNRHLPVEVMGGVIRIRPDHVIADLMTRLGAEVVACHAPFEPEIGAYAEGGGHHHDHAHEVGNGPSHAG